MSIIGLVFWAYLAFTAFSVEVNSETSSVDWSARIESVGAAKAYEELVTSLKDQSANKQHELAHAFGGSLYENLGVQGLHVCDAQFLYGCIHELVGRAITHEGVGIVTHLDQICVSNTGHAAISCQHGIGHGLLAYYGYRDSDLLKALAQCDQLTSISPTGGCYGGVFMEYNLRSMTGNDQTIREHEDYHHPCTTLTEAHRPACLYWQPQWWRSGPLRNFGSDEQVFAKMGDYCREYDVNERDICVRGVGNIIAPSVAFEPHTVYDVCSHVTVHDTASFLTCLSEAAQRIEMAQLSEQAIELCNMLHIKSDREYCEKIRLHDQ